MVGLQVLSTLDKVRPLFVFWLELMSVWHPFFLYFGYHLPSSMSGQIMYLSSTSASKLEILTDQVSIEELSHNVINTTWHMENSD